MTELAGYCRAISMFDVRLLCIAMDMPKTYESNLVETINQAQEEFLKEISMLKQGAGSGRPNTENKFGNSEKVGQHSQLETCS